MIEEFYGFSAPPFSLSPDARFYYDSPGHRQALAYLQFGLQQGEGFIVITGEIGAGKSTLINRLLGELDHNATEVAYITTSNVNPDDVLRLICSRFQLTPDGPDKASLLRALEAYLVYQRRIGRRVLVIVDEAQNLPKGTIEELRMLSNTSVDGMSAIQCFLVGQPQFKAILSDPDMEQLRQRVIASYHLDKLNQTETKRYIQHRMQVVGWTGRPEFTDDAVVAIFRATGGVPRRINNACSRLLMHGALEELEVIDAAAAQEVLSEMGTEVAEAASSQGTGLSLDARPAAPTGSPALAPQAVAELAARLQSVERKLTGIERAQTQIAKQLTDLRALEGRVEELEAHGGDGGGAVADAAGLSGEIDACAGRLQALDRQIAEALEALPQTDANALQGRLASLEEAIQSRLPANDAGQGEQLAQLGGELRVQGEILRDLMTVAMSLLGRPEAGEDEAINRIAN
ncbi:MAG: AAA family ATPase [Alphaproteobacteria bacterium]|nr:AAA family ATPase [Alphaproteobacteria bacterium]MCB9929195.1 AAA family ATPase [Alphaproteobacteria bacterium]